ncbi:DUF4291 family protein [Streptomyces sp. HYC2]|uniref:DUF4291 family protein n=1 Tax=Streptomyces sp. HYC2 TaxID=2955207 RepID=UPI00247FC60B|nr:DUF4291 family protein [Streptomyces sp. HYC2]
MSAPRVAHSTTITVYQAYSPDIGMPAVHQGRFPAAWKRDRMTWVIKPRRQTLMHCHRPKPETDERVGAVPRLWRGYSRPLLEPLALSTVRVNLRACDWSARCLGMVLASTGMGGRWRARSR